MTHTEIASAIRNKVSDALSGNISDQAFSIEQLMDEIDLSRSSIVNKLARGGKLSVNGLVQSIDTIPIEVIEPTDSCVRAVSGPCSGIPGIKVPRITDVFGRGGIEYLGLVNLQESIDVYFDPNDIEMHKFRVRTSRRPYAWVDSSVDANNMNTVYLFNLGKFNSLRYLKIRAVFDNPGAINILDPDAEFREYAAPGYVQEAIIDSITEKYIRYFRQLSVKPATIPNTQNDNIT
jgi:hypothetical protein|tara:strand:+ start:414 stop:1115 length:702 start_codon:yes stop_codon:yes gene_type:complete